MTLDGDKEMDSIKRYTKAWQERLRVCVCIFFSLRACWQFSFKSKNLAASCHSCHQSSCVDLLRELLFKSPFMIVSWWCRKNVCLNFSRSEKGHCYSFATTIIITWVATREKKHFMASLIEDKNLSMSWLLDKSIEESIFKWERYGVKILTLYYRYIYCILSCCSYIVCG